MDEHKGIINNLKPQAAFKAGLFTGLAIMFVIAFFILLGIYLNDKLNTDDNGKAANQPTTGSEIQIEGLDKKNDWLRGDKDAKVTIVEFSDVDCPYCQKFHDTTKQILENYDGQVNLVFRHFPLVQLHPDSPKKAEAAECVGDLGGNDKFWEFLDKLFAETETAADLTSMATSIGIDGNKFDECLNSGKFTAEVAKDSKAAQTAGAEGTPYSVIISGNTKIPIKGAYPYDTIKTQLDTLVK